MKLLYQLTTTFFVLFLRGSGVQASHMLETTWEGGMATGGTPEADRRFLQLTTTFEVEGDYGKKVKPPSTSSIH